MLLLVGQTSAVVDNHRLCLGGHASAVAAKRAIVTSKYTRHIRDGNGMHLGDICASSKGGGHLVVSSFWRHRSHPGMYHKTL
jgi:hypothetical protein